MKLRFLYLSLFLILMEQIPDGLALAGHKSIASLFTFVYLAGATTGLFFWFADTGLFPYDLSILKRVAGYILLRYAIGDLVFNLSAGLSPFFIGTTKFYDVIWQWFFNATHFPQVHFLLTTKFIALIMGITFLTRNYKS